MSEKEDLQKRLHRRKHNREVHRRNHQHGRAVREARAVQRLRAQLDHLHSEPRVMFDDTRVELIPKSARAVAGYVNGSFTTWPEVLHDFPHARHISIAVSSSAHAHCLDVEVGDATIYDAADWFRRFKDASAKNKQPHLKPIFYTSASVAASLIAELDAAGIHRHEYILWTAHYNGHRHVCSPKSCGYPAAEATQWTDHSDNRTLDESMVLPAFWERG